MQTKRCWFAALMFMSAMATPVWAEDVNCDNAMTTHDINLCADAELQKVEKNLNVVYQRVMAALAKAEDPTVRTQLLEAQRAWVKFREADCDAVYSHHQGGTMRTVMHIGCMQQHAERRIADLEEFLQ
jgi:uncharacterized protein YecT (DUF1311 family)